MSRSVYKDGHTYEINVDMIDVTSIHRPDTGWRHTDSHGHLHQWYDGDAPAVRYDPSTKYSVPSIIWIKDGEYWDDDMEEMRPYGHNECSQCHDRLEPVYTADSFRQHVPGLKSYLIDGEPVSEEEFKRRATEAGLWPKE